MWECVGGSVVKGEDSLTGAIREAQEEVGVLLSPEKGTRIHSEVRKMVNGRKFNDILDVWLFEHDGPILLEQATTKEVAQSDWMSKAEIQALLNEGKLVPTLRYFMDML
jgi:8-oxo-dGTP pyrophosphatase MutT (NUDIX family)